MKFKYVEAYMDIAKRFAKLSTAKRLQVGAIVVKDDRIVSIGYNGTPPGWDNNCEDIEWMPRDTGGWIDPAEIYAMYPLVGNHSEYGEWHYRLKTKPEVIHAEANAIAKLAKSVESGEGATMFLTHAPCLDCAKQIFAAGIKSIYFGSTYRSYDGIKFLKKCGVEVNQPNLWNVLEKS